MNIVVVPYHDWRKIEMEGARTRDSHIISHLAANKDIENLIILNRPISYLELMVKKKMRKISGKLLFRYKQCSLYELAPKFYVIDYISNSFLGPIRDGKKWFFDSYGDDEFISGYEKCVDYLKININIILTQNVFSAKFCSKVKTPAVFDGWDNFLLFPENSKLQANFISAYTSLAKTCEAWVTNASKNIEFYNKHYNPKSCHLVKNGVDVETFSKSYKLPTDLKNISRPIVGFGGKITHLFDYELFNYIVKDNSDKSFVIVGQILDSNVFSKIIKAKNVYYLGDKHYKQYPSYVTNFDIGIIPYVTNSLEHGADSIKVYEYIASGLKVVGTAGAGMSDMQEYIYIGKTKEEFSAIINRAISDKNTIILPEFYTWKYKSQTIVKLLKQVAMDRVSVKN
ncbi:glycosyltransferase family 1 protein [Pontibacter sp. SGAir0037]|uniref:glycosyltransferase family 1 protein n=1 Tax=Pontibacter sp. SGAir0037 TaxID=2571030 RepID=UPI0010CCEC68|nr:glycosyltransferase family 1 protein [Pontibacter sp. SGAir0037]QCR20983.1 hypothetical protein C1N53_00450 [Pontibacter sp. SGAir0037]